jgi:hypothetical protein
MTLVTTNHPYLKVRHHIKNTLALLGLSRHALEMSAQGAGSTDKVLFFSSTLIHIGNGKNTPF